MQRPTLPLDRLRFFRQELDISADVLATLEPYAGSLAQESPRMARDLFEAMSKMAQTKIVLEHETSPYRLRSNWSRWYETLWKSPCDDSLLASLWHSGLRHVNHGVDHRFITLAYSQVRRFSHDRIQEVVPENDRESVHILADRLFDLCILVESDAYIAAQAHCSNDVMMGIAHQLRNPLTVIGGMAGSMLRKQKQSPELQQLLQGTLQDSLQAVLEEANRMERMMRDLVAYIDMLRNEPQFQSVSLHERLEAAIHDLKKDVDCEALLRFGKGQARVQADPDMLRNMLFHLLENAVEAQKDAMEQGRPPMLLAQLPEAPGEQGQSSPFLSLEICNPGAMPASADIEALFQPFHSSKPFGTGLGLAIARLAAHKNFGTVQLQPWQEEGRDGVCCRVTLVKAGHVHPSGLFFTSPEEQ